MYNVTLRRFCKTLVTVKKAISIKTSKNVEITNRTIGCLFLYSCSLDDLCEQIVTALKSILK
jgi:hypothetical protein